MPNKKSPRHLIAQLEPDQSVIVYAPEQPGKVIAQVSRVADIYYLVGPLLYDYLPEVHLNALFEVGLENQDSEANVANMLNKVLADCGVPVEARVYACHGVRDTLDTLTGLFAAYSLAPLH